MKYPRILPQLDRRRTFSPADIVKIKELYNGGTTIHRLTKLYNKPYSSIQYLVDSAYCEARKAAARAANARKRLNPNYKKYHRKLSAASHRYKRQVMATSEKAFDAADNKNWKNKNPTKWKRLMVRHTLLAKLKIRNIL